MRRPSRPGFITGNSNVTPLEVEVEVDQAALAKGLAQLADILDVIAETVEGKRQNALRMGWDDEHSQDYALQCHQYILASMLTAQANP